MEQLAHFVTKSFEYNNNRVLEVLNMSTKSNSSLSDEHSCSNSLSGGGGGDGGDSSNHRIDDVDMDDTIDIDITDLSDSGGGGCDDHDENDVVGVGEKCKSDGKVKISCELPLPLIKRINRDGSKHITRNWLISDLTPNHHHRHHDQDNKKCKIVSLIRIRI